MNQRKSPTAKEIRDARKTFELSQSVAAELCFSTLRSWQNWEAGTTRMHPAIWAWWQATVTGQVEIPNAGEFVTAAKAAGYLRTQKAKRKKRTAGQESGDA